MALALNVCCKLVVTRRNQSSYSETPGDRYSRGLRDGCDTLSVRQGFPWSASSSRGSLGSHAFLSAGADATEKVDFIGQADSYQRAARALRRIDQWWRDFGGFRGASGTFE